MNCSTLHLQFFLTNAANNMLVKTTPYWFNSKTGQIAQGSCLVNIGIHKEVRMSNLDFRSKQNGLF